MQGLDQSKISFNTDNKTANISYKKPQKIKITQKCISGNTLSQFCVNGSCKNINNFLCHDEQCQCYQNHEYCLKASIKIAIKSINQKFTEGINKMKNEISQFFMKLIDKISQYEVKMLIDIENSFKINILTEEEQKFVEMFIEQKDQYLKQFNGQKLQDLWKKIDKSNKNPDQYQNIFKLNFSTLMKNIQTTSIQGIKRTIDSLTQSLKTQKYDFNQQPFTLETLNSSILTKQSQLTTIKRFLPHKLKRLIVKFKASQNNFSMSKYYQKCGHLSSTIILVQTIKDKIIGGYTPLSFNPTPIQFYQYVPDPSSTSFIFSLTNHDKFSLIDNSIAITRYKNKEWINFGKGLLCIEDKANQKNQNQTCLGVDVYKNSNYKDNEASYLKINGNKNSYFMAKEWEVLQVEFQY